MRFVHGRRKLPRKLPLWGPLAAMAALLLGGCAVGPNFKKPAAPNVPGYQSTPLATTSQTPNVPGGDAQQFFEGRDIPAEWWALFHSQPLSDLIQQALKANPSLKAAQAALIVARETTLAQRGFYYPSVNGGFSASRQGTSQALAPVPNSNNFNFSLFTPQVSVSYAPDVFGLNRRTVESLKAQEEGTRYALIATDLTLTSNVVEGAIEEASLRGQIDVTHELITINTDMLQVLRNQFAAGYVATLDVAAQEAQLAQVQATLPPLLKQLAQQRDLLTALVGSLPNQDLPQTFALTNLQLPQDLPVSLPSKLVEQRPDILQAEENIHSANAQVGVAIANRFPSFMLTADGGSSALQFGQIFGASNWFYDLAASVTQPIYAGGTLKHRELAAKAALDEAGQQYQSTVITAFQSVADTLHAIQQDADALKAASTAKDAAQVALDQVRRQYNAGYTNYLALLNAESSYQQAVITLVQAETNRYADSAALFQALGGGWWNRPDIPKS